MLKQKPSPPLSELTIEITRKCLLNCVHCSVLAERESREYLTKMEIERIFEDFLKLGGKELSVSGGEPFCHPDLYEVIQFAKDRDLIVELYSCGFFRNDNGMDAPDPLEKAKKLKKLKVDKVSVNLQGPNADIHDEITTIPGSFEDAVKFINALVKEELYVGINYVPMTPNFEAFPDLLDYAQQLHVKEVSVLRFVPQGRGKLNEEWLRLSKDESDTFIEMLINATKRQDIKVRPGAHIDFRFLFNHSLPPKPCKAGIEKCLVKANGDVVPCSAFKELSSYVVGNIRRSSLQELWIKSPIFTFFREFDINKLQGACATCPSLNACKGRCIAQRIHRLGGPYKGPDPYCPRV